jgi:PhnB protein
MEPLPCFTSRNLSFLRNCKEAFEFYEKALGGQSPESGKMPAAIQNQVIHARLSAGDSVIYGSDCPPDVYTKPQGFSVAVGTKDPAETERVFNALSRGGQVHMPLQQTFWSAKFGMLQDKFGISWMVNCAQAA